MSAPTEEGGGGGKGETKPSVKRVSREDLKAKILQAYGRTRSWPMNPS